MFPAATLPLILFLLISFNASATDQENLDSLNASRRETAAFEELVRLHSELARLIEPHRGLVNGQTDAPEQPMAEVARTFHRYQVASIAFWTDLVFARSNASTESANSRQSELRKSYDKFKEHQEAVERLLSRPSELGVRGLSAFANHMSQLGLFHRRIMAEATSLRSGQEPSRLLNPARNWLGSVIARGMASLLDRGWSPLKALGRAMLIKFRLARAPLRHNIAEWSAGLDDDTFHIVLAGHGSPYEVAAIIGSLARRSRYPISAVQAAHHFAADFFPGDPASALRLADSLMLNSSFMAVLKDDSVFAGQGEPEQRFDDAVKQAVRDGKRILVIFPEGRNPALGGHSPVNVMSFKALRLIKRAIDKVTNQENKISISILSPVLPNIQSTISPAERQEFQMRILPLSQNFADQIIEGRDDSVLIAAAQLMDTYILAHNLESTGLVGGLRSPSDLLSHAVNSVPALSVCEVSRDIASYQTQIAASSAQPEN